MLVYTSLRINASRTNKFRVFLHCLGRTQTNYVVFSWNEETVFPIWCHDIWWSILLDNSNRFINTGLGSIPSVPFRLILSLPYWSWQFSQERTPCSWNMLDNNEPPWRQKFETWLQLFHWGKKLILDELPKLNKFEKIRAFKKKFNENRLNHFSNQNKDPGHTLERILFPNEPVQNAYFSTTWPIVFKT